MGVFKKLKDVLFDIEEEEIPVITKTTEEKKVVSSEKENKIKVEENTIKEIKIPKEELPEKEIVKKPEPKFNFPLDMEDKPVSRASRSFDFSEPDPKAHEPKDYSRILREEPKKDAHKPFKPTPVISPVYGILDQNYSKDDIIVKTDIGVKGPDLDEVRKKAYGLEKKEAKKRPEPKIEPAVIIEDDPIKTLDEILMAEEQEQLNRDLQDAVIMEEEIEIPAKTEAEKNEDTLETDLFNLIDSMYEDKEEGEEE